MIPSSLDLSLPQTGDPFGGLPDGLDLEGLNRQAALAAGLPDPATLANLASSFFGTLGRVDSGASVDSLVLSPIAAPQISSQFPSQPTSIPAVPRSIPQASSFSPAGIPVGLPTSPQLPGEFSEASAFSFLRDSRSIFGAPPAFPAHAVPLPAVNVPLGARVPTENDMRGNPVALPGNPVPQFPVLPKEAKSPSLPGNSLKSAEFSQGSGIEFLDLTRSISESVELFEENPLAPEVHSSIPTSTRSGAIDVNSVRRDFPILAERVNGRPLVWLDNAATTQKPQAVIDRLVHFYEHENSNIHRAAHELAARSTDAYEGARERVRGFLNASSVGEIIFVRGATEGINLVARSWGEKNIQKDDEIVVSILEHHANIVPWQMLCSEKGAKLRVAPVDASGQILLDEYEKLLNSRTKLVAITHVSNALGTVTPVHEITAAAKRHGATVLIDGSQAVSHMPVDVQSIDCDFYVFSGHKVFAPTGIGVVFGKQEVLAHTPPYQGGGNMIVDVTFERTVFQTPPFRFEAGTGSIADAVGLGAAIDYLHKLGMDNIARYEHDLLVYGTESLQRIPGLHLIGTAKEKASVISFVLDGFKTEEVGSALNREGIAVRSGHHCAQPILRHYGLESTVRPSLAFYNTCEEIDALVDAIWNIKNGRHPSLL